MRSIFPLIATAGLLLAGCTHGNEAWEGDYAAHYSDSPYAGHPMSYNDRIFAGEDGRFYCQRHDGSLGLAVMAGGGPLPANLLRQNRSAKLGALIGSDGGTAVRHAVDAGALICR